MLRSFLLILVSFLFTAHNWAVNKKDTTYIKYLLETATALQTTHGDSCHQLAMEAYSLSKLLNYQSGIRGAYIRIGSVLMTKGFHDSALIYINNAISISKSMGNNRKIANAYLLKSIIYGAKALQDSAFKAIYQALHYSQLANDSNTTAQIYNALGGLHTDFKDFGKSHLNYSIALKMAENLNNETIQADALIGIGTVFYRSQNPKEALSYYLRAESIFKENNDDVGYAQNLNNIALCYGHLKQVNKALYYYSKALKLYKQLGMQGEEANLYYNIASLYFDLKNPQKAIEFLYIALPMAKKTRELEKVSFCYQKLAEAYSMLGNYKMAYTYQLQYTALSDSIMSEEKISSISEMQTKYATTQKEQQIILLDEQGKTRKAQRNFFFAVTIVFVLGFCILGFYYIQRQKLAKKNEQLAQQDIASLLSEQEIKSYNAMIVGQEEERQRIASDLHDRLGSMLSTIKLLYSSLNIKELVADEEDKEQYEKANNLLDDACVEVRKISHNLSTGMVMSFGLVAALDELCESINKSKRIKCKLLAYGMDERLDNKMEIGIYRMVQELFNNILKHAKAQNITVQLNRLDNGLNLTIEDDGIGFDVEEKKKAGGLGLKNLASRAAKLKGTYLVDSHPGKGTISIIEIPINKANHYD